METFPEYDNEAFGQLPDPLMGLRAGLGARRAGWERSKGEIEREERL